MNGVVIDDLKGQLLDAMLQMMDGKLTKQQFRQVLKELAAESG